MHRLWLVSALSVGALAAAPTAFTDPLTKLPPLWQSTGDWLVLSGRYQASPDGLVAADGDALLTATAPISAGRVSVVMTPRRRVQDGGWASMGPRLAEDGRRFWLISLTEDPDGKTHRIELVEMLDGEWQAQSAAGTRLEATTTGTAAWSWGTAYAMEIEVAADAVIGRVKPAGAADWQWTCRYAVPAEAKAVRSGRLGLRSQAAEAVFAQAAVNGSASDRGRITGTRAVVVGFPGLGATGALAKLARDAGYQIRLASPVDLKLDPALDGLLLVDSLRRLPVSTMRAVVEWIEQGGDLYAGGAEPFADPLFKLPDGTWKTRDDALAAVDGRGTALDLGRDAGLRVATNNSAAKSELLYGQPGPAGARDAARLSLPEFNGWHTLAANEARFGAGETLTVVWVKGTPGQATTLEWREDDGSRWIAAIPLTDTWTKHVLDPSAFGFWADGSPEARRDTQFRPDHAKGLSFGPATGFGTTHAGPFELHIGSIRTAASPVTFEAFTPPVIETLSPWYKQWETADGRRIPYQRPRGQTLAAELEGRHQTLAGGLSRYVTTKGAAIFWQPSGVGNDAEALRAARAGVWLLNGGPEKIVHVEGEPVPLGARLLNCGAANQKVSVRVTVDGRPQTIEVDLAAGAQRGALVQPATGLGVGLHRVGVEVLVAGQVVDSGATPLRIVPKTPVVSAARRVRVQGDTFRVGGRPVFLNGVNYWPRNVSGLEPDRYNNGWLKRENYDPDVVEADLALMQKLGLNLVSIQPGHPEPMIDFLERCRAHGIWVNLFTSSAGGLGFNPEHDRDLLTSARVVGNDTVAMLDLHWEPRLGNHAERTRWDGEWRAWIVEQYGSVESAERAWGLAAPREAGQVSNPTDQQIGSDGPHRIMVAAYRRFADDLISRRYGRVCRSLRSLDPDLLLGVRTGYGGTGQEWAGRVMAYDLTSGAAHLDFASPEGYGMSPDWAKASGTGFITAWGKWAGAGKPVFWAEFGHSIGARGGTPDTRAQQTAIWRGTLRLCLQDRAAASAGWWWPGGWRVNERSDYGVVEPDGTPREALLAAAEVGQQVQAELLKPAPDSPTLLVDRDADARGLFGLWSAKDAEFRRLTAQGKSVRLVTEATGKSTRDMPLVQVGNVPYAGSGPLKHANAEVAGIEVVWPGGSARGENGQALSVAGGGPLKVTVKLVNTGEAAWDGCRLTLGAETLDVPATPRFGTAEVIFTLTAEGDRTLSARVSTAAGAAFGETVRVRLVAK